MNIKCVIIDDDIVSSEILKSYVESIQGFEISSVCTNAVSAFDIIQHKNIDLVFLDIEMPKLSGIDFIKTLKLKKPPKFVICTANTNYALECYELDVLDYIVKPIHFERFLKAINKYYQYSASTALLINSLPNISNEKNSFVYVKENKKVIKLYLSDLLFIESIKNYVRIVTINKSIITKQAISYFEDLLPNQDFLRIHRSFIVSISKIEAFSASEIEIGNKQLPIGRSYKKTVLNSLNYNEPL